MQAERRLSRAVIEAVAEAEGVKPTQLSEPLFTVIEPDALNKLFHADDGTVTFTYCGYEVTVDATGKVEVEPID